MNGFRFNNALFETGNTSQNKIQWLWPDTEADIMEM